MTPKKIPTNDLDRALMALVKSKSALPQFLRELGKGELWFLTPFHPEIIGGTVELENGMRSPFMELEDAEGPYVPVFSSFERLQESMRACRVPEDSMAAASMAAMQVLDLLGKMELRGMINMACKTGAIYLPPEMMRDVADGSVLEPLEPTGETISRVMRNIDPADYPTDLLQPVFEILRQHRNFRAAWIVEDQQPEGAAAKERHFQFLIHSDPRDAAVYHEFNLVLASAARATGLAAESGQVDETDTEYLASLWRSAEPFYIAPDHARPKGH
ncbi:MAG: SseB family protein [Luteolibacter sp.]